VGSFAIQILSQIGFSVTAVSRKADAQDYLRALGASEVVHPDSLETAGKPLEAARWGGGVDNLGDGALAYMTRTVQPWGNIASIGLAQGVGLETTVMPFILRGVSLLGIHSVECPRPLRETVWQQLAGAWKPKALERIVGRTLSLDEVPDYCQQVVAGEVTGRALVRLGG